MRISGKRMRKGGEAVFRSEREGLRFAGTQIA